MQLKIFVRFFTFVLAAHFSVQLVLPTSQIEMAQIEVDVEMDSEEKESKSKSEIDKLNHSYLLSRLKSQRKNCVLVPQHNYWWISPTIEMIIPPPEKC
ncbi:MAG: hypothetical protein ABJP45_13150 [Cyclobacteriaceae bacterium]